MVEVASSRGPGTAALTGRRDARAALRADRRLHRVDRGRRGSDRFRLRADPRV